MRLPDPDVFFAWLIIAAVALSGLLVAAFITYKLVAYVGEDRARDRCGHLGGKVEFYDEANKDLWRCVGARPEAG